jgi:hypothetical protein
MPHVSRHAGVQHGCSLLIRRPLRSEMSGHDQAGAMRAYLRLAIGGRHWNCDGQWGVHYLMIAFHVKYKSETI